MLGFGSCHPSGSLGIAVKVRVCGGNFVVEPQNYPHIFPQPRQLPENHPSLVWLKFDKPVMFGKSD